MELLDRTDTLFNIDIGSICEYTYNCKIASDQWWIVKGEPTHAVWKKNLEKLIAILAGHCAVCVMAELMKIPH